MQQPSRTRRNLQVLTQASAILGIALMTFTAAATAHAEEHGNHGDHHDAHFRPGNIVVSRSVYDNNPANVTVGTVLPPNCASTQGGCAAATGAPFKGTYPFVFNDVLYDASFGITSRVYLDQLTSGGHFVDSLEVPNSLQKEIKSTSDQLVTSFSSSQSWRFTSRPTVAASASWAMLRRRMRWMCQTPTRRARSI
jgi:hypothetical protein